MTVCYVVVAYTQPIISPGDLQALGVFDNQYKAQQYADQYTTGPDQHIMICTSLMDNQVFDPVDYRKISERSDALRRLDGLSDWRYPSRRNYSMYI